MGQRSGAGQKLNVSVGLSGVSRDPPPCSAKACGVGLAVGRQSPVSASGHPREAPCSPGEEGGSGWKENKQSWSQWAWAWDRAPVWPS